MGPNSRNRHRSRHAVDRTPQVLLTPAQAAAFGGYSFVLHGLESDTDDTRPTDRGGLTVRETIPSNCATLTPDATATTAHRQLLRPRLRRRERLRDRRPGLSRQQHERCLRDLLTLVAELSAANRRRSTYNFRIAEPADQQCSGVRSEQPDIPDDNPLLGSHEATAGSLRTVEGALTNSTPFTDHIREISTVSSTRSSSPTTPTPRSSPVPRWCPG